MHAAISGPMARPSSAYAVFGDAITRGTRNPPARAAPPVPATILRLVMTPDRAAAIPSPPFHRTLRGRNLPRSAVSPTGGKFGEHGRTPAPRWRTVHRRSHRDADHGTACHMNRPPMRARTENRPSLASRETPAGSDILRLRFKRPPWPRPHHDVPDRLLRVRVARPAMAWKRTHRFSCSDAWGGSAARDFSAH